MMKRRFKAIIMIFGIFAVMAAITLGILWYKTRFEVAVVARVQSSDGNYELVLQSVGEPYWPFGAAPGRLVLKSGETVVARADFEIANDGAFFNAQSWKVTWYDDHVEIILSGEEQYDELVTLYYNGEIENCRLTTRYGVEKDSVLDRVEEEEADTEAESDSEAELFSGEWQITAGYKAIYELYSDKSSDHFEIYYGASETSTRCVLSENENTIEYVVYDGKSENERCGLYVRYQSVKNDDGSWSYTNGTIVDIYAYVYENGDVISSGKTDWGDTGSEAYQEITGEK